MEAHALRLASKFKLSREDAQALVEAGFDTPAKVKEAKAKDLEAIVGKGKIQQQKK